MLFVFDSSSFIVMSHLYPDRFPTFWEQLNDLVESEVVVSVREVRRELDSKAAKPHLEKWISEHGSLFRVPAAEETEIVADIFAVRRFMELVRRKQLLSGTPVADPFVIAAAKAKGGSVVTEESERPNSARIPNVCRHFGVACTNLEGFMERENMRY